ncbi:MAG: PilZ domain-containing protein [Pseudomonadota bacterium]
MDDASSSNRLAADLSQSQIESCVDAIEDPDKPNSLQKRAPRRRALLIRAAKLVSSHGEFVCVLRDVSETGISLRLFHSPPTGEPIELHMPDGKSYALRPIWCEDFQAGYEFEHKVELSDFFIEANQFPKRPLRLSLFFPAAINSLAGPSNGVIQNLSQQGACFSCEGMFAIDQNLRLECSEREIGFGEVDAKVRWRRDSDYGVVFENTLSLEEFARLAAKLQCPELLREPR